MRLLLLDVKSLILFFQLSANFAALLLYRGRHSLINEVIHIFLLLCYSIMLRWNKVIVDIVKNLVYVTKNIGFERVYVLLIFTLKLTQCPLRQIHTLNCVILSSASLFSVSNLASQPDVILHTSFY